MDVDLDALKTEALEAIRAAGDAKALQALRVRYLGRKSSLIGALRGLGKLAADERAEAGRKTNDVKQAVEAALDERAAALTETRESSLADA